MNDSGNRWSVFRLVPKSSTLDDLELLYVQIFTEFCGYSITATDIVLWFTRGRHFPTISLPV